MQSNGLAHDVGRTVTQCSHLEHRECLYKFNTHQPHTIQTLQCWDLSRVVVSRGCRDKAPQTGGSKDVASSVPESQLEAPGAPLSRENALLDLKTVPSCRGPT